MKYGAEPSTSADDVTVVSLKFDGSDAWRLEPIIELLQRGEVGIIPTDTLPALVCSVKNRKAATKLYSVKEIDSKKPLSILCRCDAR